MSKGVQAYIAQRQAEAEAARILGEALVQAFAVLTQAGVESPEDVIAEIVNADGEGEGETPMS